MKATFSIPLILLTLFSIPAFSQQSNSPTLMTIGNEKVSVAEFMNVYKKNNKDSTAMDKKSLEEYLNLYSIFRLKVKEAKEMGMDTTKAFTNELDGYRKTLAKPYLTDKEAEDSLVKEAYNRMKWDIRTSHILIRLNNDPDPADTLEAYTEICYIRDFINGKAKPAVLNKFQEMVKKNLKISKTSPPKDTLTAYGKLHPLKEMSLLKKHDFASVAKVVSEHSSKANGGDIGYLSGMSDQNIPYEYENAAYNAKEGVVYGPFRTPLGYHLILVTDKRPHVEIHLAHIMLVFRRTMTHQDSVKMKTKIDSISGLLKQGADFKELAEKVSEHRKSAANGGDIGWLSISANYPPIFKSAAFALKDGQISEPIETKYGWHIIKRIGSRGLQPFDSLKANLNTRIQHDPRNIVAKQIMIAKIKKQYHYKELSKSYTDFYAIVDSTLPLGLWKIERAKDLNKPLFSMLDKIYAQQDFAQFIVKNHRMESSMSSRKMVNELYKKFIDESVMNLKESRLEKEYPEFKMLMDEYRDGILLFNLTDKKVWTKAIKDTVGAKQYYEDHKDHFKWEDRLDASIYTCKDEKTAEKVRKLIDKNKSDKEILTSINKNNEENVTIESSLFMKGDNKMLDSLNWKLGLSPDHNIKNKIVFANLRKIEKNAQKSYTDARGLVISEYQTWLENQWIDALKKKYPVSIDKKVFDSIIK